MIAVSLAHTTELLAAHTYLTRMDSFEEPHKCGVLVKADDEG